MSGTIIGWRGFGVALLVWFATALAALETPVRLSEGGTGPDPSDVLPEKVGEVAPEDLGAFLASRRWGVSLDELREAAAPPPPPEPPAPEEPEEPAINPVLAEMGYIGLIVAGDESAVLLKSPEGGVVRMAPGDVLPDGRTLASVTGNSITLKGDGVPEEVLTLFPPPRTGRFEVHVEGNAVVYVKTPCARDGTQEKFFLHVVPVDRKALPKERRKSGFANLDFDFDARGTVVGETCRARVALPEYAVASIRTGQYVPGQGKLWAEQLSLQAAE